MSDFIGLCYFYDREYSVFWCGTRGLRNREACETQRVENQKAEDPTRFLGHLLKLPIRRLVATERRPPFDVKRSPFSFLGRPPPGCHWAQRTIPHGRGETLRASGRMRFRPPPALPRLSFSPFWRDRSCEETPLTPLCGHTLHQGMP